MNKTDNAYKSIGEVAKLLNLVNKHIIYVGALGTQIDEGDLSVHQFILNSDFKIENQTIIPISERVRDLIYIEELNKIFIYLESSASIGILEKIN